MGRRLFDIVDGPGGWNDRTGYGAGEVGTPPFVVLASQEPESVRLTELDWTFVTSGLSDALVTARARAERASKAADTELDVVVMGGGATIGSALAAGVVDSLTLHLAPVVLGGGTPVFVAGRPLTLTRRDAVTTSTATHLTFDVTG